MKIISSLSFFILFFQLTILEAQYIADSEFIWNKGVTQLTVSSDQLIFTKVESDPVLEHPDFEGLLEKLINTLNLRGDINGVMKIKIQFSIDKTLFVSKVGTKNFVLTRRNLVGLCQYIGEVKLAKPGQQRGLDVNCSGILYLYLKCGSLERTRILNFE